MKTMKKAWWLLLAFCMVSGLMSCACAAETNMEEQITETADETETEWGSETERESEMAEETQGSVSESSPTVRDTSDDGFYKIVHLDCGRKYFTRDWIIALLHEMKTDGYNQLQLAFGNDGLRFLLDDMSFAANGRDYGHDAVVSAVESGNKAQNNSDDASWLTESEMDAIITAANELGIEIVPLLNLPGHANAILDIADDQYNVSGSQNTLDMSRTEAVNFAMAIFQKYVNYFAEKGCRFFNFGADEYANDITGGFFSFSRLDADGYQSFVAFINQLADCISGKGMTPRAFNDGLYYNSQTADIRTGIQCCYWSPGWMGYDVAPASTIKGKNHDMINTNGDYYYVLGKTDQFDDGYSYAVNWDNNTYGRKGGGAETVSSSGAMFCIWCDDPNAETETQVAANTRLVLRAVAAQMSGDSADTIDTDTVVTKGFNADGTIHK